MNADTVLNDFARFIRSRPAVERFDEVHLIVNPVAGGFTRKKVFESIAEQFYKIYRIEENKPEFIPEEMVHIHETHAPGDCGNVVRGILSRFGEEKRILFIIFGGDGTATEAASEIHRYIERGGTGDNTVLFRLPMGTGNDGLDADTMETAFTICRGPCVSKKIPLLEIKLASGIKKYATNIASFGLDAYVTDKTNKLKKAIAGSFYSVMVDVAALFYELSADMSPFEIEYTDDKGVRREESFTALLLAMGVTGNRTYGGGKLVLPGHENVCRIGRMKLRRKFAVKELLYKGEHTELDEVVMFTAGEMKVSFPSNILFQHDGEVIPLSPDDFPVGLKVLPPSVQVLRPEDATILKNQRGRGE